MPTYALLYNPGHNRVYFQSAKTLALRELSLVSPRLSTPVKSAKEVELGGVPYCLFETDAPLSAEDGVLLSRLSFVYAFFALENAGAPVLTPLVKNNSYFFSEDISTILKYMGKTNELFTRMMINMAVFCGSFDWKEPLQILDPLCGKGTTLFESLLCGYNACGVEVDDKMLHEAYVFFKKYLETGRYKHSTHMERIGGEDRDHNKINALRYQLRLARSKADQKSAKMLQVEMVAGDTRHADYFYRKNSFHAIVGDLPYGVQHNQKNPQGGSSRNAMGMLTDALPGWCKILKPGGTVVLAWNIFLIPRSEIKALFAANGLQTLEGEVFDGFSHRVDQAIERDVIIGVKPL